MPAQRRFIRYPVSDEDIVARTIYGMHVTVLNMGLLGSTISHSKPLGANTDFLLILNTGEETFDLNAELVWQKLSGYHKNRKGESVPYYTTGLRFLDLLTPKGNQLKDFLLDGRESAESRLTSRIFKMNEAVRASLMEFTSCTVRNLSSGGMQIERQTNLRPEERLPIEVSIPGESHFLVRGRVACCLEQTGEAGSYYDIGIEFAEIADVDRRSLDGLIRTLANRGTRPD